MALSFVKDEGVALAAERRPEEAVLDQAQGHSKLAGMDLRRSPFSGVTVPVVLGAAMLTTLAVAAPFPGDACKNAPTPVMLAIEPGWTLLRLKDLNSDDQKLWVDARPRSCPGYATANMRTGPRPAYVVALIDRRGAKLREKVVLLVPDGKRFVSRTLWTPAVVGNPAVVWRAPPGKYHAWDEDRSITIPNDSVVLETMESSAEQFYFAGRRLRSLTTSN